jgi:formylglycine-generating enzyme required for sulfatase activity
VLPSPFEWCHIPAGNVVLDDASSYGGTEGGRVWVEAFFIARYPITNVQYDVFVDDPDGYPNHGWWGYSPDAQKWRRDNPKPLGTAFGNHHLPCTHITWYEAVAFCDWLSYKTGLEITLPTEEQWQRAAQGDTAWAYPWGDEIDPDRCNYGGHVGQPTPVTQYPSGASPFGVMDMIGNVFEWCLTEWGTGKNDVAGSGPRVLRGGAFLNDPDKAHCASRLRQAPSISADSCGFRIVASALE